MLQSLCLVVFKQDTFPWRSLNRKAHGSGCWLQIDFVFANEVNDMKKITIPVKCYTKMPSPYAGDRKPYKVRFLVSLKDVPPSLTEWMSTNPREQNLTSPVARAIAASIREDSRDFHMKNRGILLSAKTVEFIPEIEGATDGLASIVFDDPSIHGNVDGGHTLRLILASQSETGLPEQYVEFEVMVGLNDLLPIAEARNASVALDMRSMEELRGSFNVWKSLFGNIEVSGNRFFDRVELKMNQQLEETNRIDIRTVISIILMFNVDAFPHAEEMGKAEDMPVQMCGNPEAALKKFLALGDGDTEKRDESVMKMAPIVKDIVILWDTIEKELPLVKEKQYSQYKFATRLKTPRAMFSDMPTKYAVPQSIMFPVIAAFRALVEVGEDGSYSWAESPLDAWRANKKPLVNMVLDNLKSAKGNLSSIAKRPIYWSGFYSTVLLYKYHNQL